jgi:mRNA interferase YafQ
LSAIITLLVEDNPLPPNAVDHPLIDKLKDGRDCHIKPDLILIYRKPDDNSLKLVCLGSQSELGF